MKHTKTEKITYLFREIGAIDDRLIHEAATWQPRRSAMPRVLLVAACLALSLALTVGAFVMASRRDKGEDAGAVGTPPTSETPASPDLDAVLLSQRETASYTTLSSAEEMDLFSGKVQVVWQYADTDELCVSRALSAGEVKDLTSQIGKGASVGESSPTLSCKVWIVMGDGRVVSPYLKSSAGNCGSDLFDYNAELLPSEDLVSCISEILA